MHPSLVHEANLACPSWREGIALCAPRWARDGRPTLHAGARPALTGGQPHTHGVSLTHLDGCKGVGQPHGRGPVLLACGGQPRTHVEASSCKLRWGRDASHAHALTDIRGQPCACLGGRVTLTMHASKTSVVMQGCIASHHSCYL